MRQMVTYEMLIQLKIIKTSAPKCGTSRLPTVVVYERFQL